MTKRMLIDATHPEEVRVAVVDGTHLEELDVETSIKKQIKGNIYLAKVIRTEPSLQAAFVEYGGNRHGFLAFSEIHPDYYQIPVADKEKLREAMLAEQRAKEAEAERIAAETAPAEQPQLPLAETPAAIPAPEENAQTHDEFSQNIAETLNVAPEEAHLPNACAAIPEASVTAPAEEYMAAPSTGEVEDIDTDTDADIDEVIKKPAFLKHYKIQEVIKKGQVILIQVLKEERGNKGAALTTYLSLAGRYCVLMPNTAHGGGVSRKITNVAERKSLKQILSGLKIPAGMGVIVRTAGKDKDKNDIKRDYDYLIKTWTEVRDRTLKATAPALVHEEGNLVKRALRDLYTKDIEEIVVDGEPEFKYARDFMKMISPQHARRVSLYKNNNLPLFNRYQIEGQIAMIHSPVIQLRSGGYLVVNQTEALVAIDINSGRSTKERGIEETALRTNLEAADEIARQLRLRDLSGLIVIDFIDMDENRNNNAVERRMKEALKKDKARVQVGRISGFGLMEMSRQRLHSSFLEASYNQCPHCKGTGLIRSVESCALSITRIIEEEVYKNQLSKLTMTLNPEVAQYILNYKRDLIYRLEKAYKLDILVLGDEALVQRMDYRLEKVKGQKQEGPEIEQVEVKHDQIPETETAPEDTQAATDDTQPQEQPQQSSDQQQERGNNRRGGRRNFYKKRSKFGNKNGGDNRNRNGNGNGNGNNQHRQPREGGEIKVAYDSHNGGHNDNRASQRQQHAAPANDIAHPVEAKKKGWWQRLIK